MRFAALLSSALSFVLSGCDSFTVREAEIQASINKQLPIQGIINVQVRAPEGLGGLDGILPDLMRQSLSVQAQLDLQRLNIALLGDQGGYVMLDAEPMLSTRILGVGIEEPLRITGSAAVRWEADSGALYLDNIQVLNVESRFINRFVPDGVRKPLWSSISDWLNAYYGAYPVYKLKEPVSIASKIVGAVREITVEDDMVRFRL
ncbi:DUF1439 domain-containing protein [Hahella sp. KA22]|uniref:DUF1439 domain-containing protein n=1 Tax=Hahella sp. KA22 TaxID=1628392 RepID=UPI000FDE3DCB|nr:DUF1439 domain-containing protein [Hahella sp. KA22]AZZ91513.1 DUF1439 domain-containing protein [Hahella sp. KA22]QAY54882.1 DUF1439 domain-containing protein [Hahella sp. KA22]